MISRSPGCWRAARTSCRWSGRAAATGWPNRSARLNCGSAAALGRDTQRMVGIWYDTHGDGGGIVLVCVHTGRRGHTSRSTKVASSTATLYGGILPA
jgi:hypothetical protein